MPSLHTALLLTAAVAAATAAAEAKPLVIVREGKPEASIVLAGEAARSAQLAAYEVQHHVRLITGATLPIVREGEPVAGARILVGESEATRALGVKSDSFGPQEYLVRFLPDAVVLIGRDALDTGRVVYDMEDPAACDGLPGFWEERGTLHAAYGFLERSCDVRWLNPTELGTSCPAKRTLAVSGREVRRRPWFRYRDAIGATGGNPARYDAYVALWPESAEEYRAWDAEAYAGLHRRYTGGRTQQARANLARLFLLRMRNGGEIAACNHSLYGYYARFWEKDAARPELFVEQRPDYFARGYQGQPPQLCYTSPGLVKQVAQDARDYYDGKKTGRDLGIFWNPALPNPFPVEPMDNSFFCKCANCQAYLKKEGAGGSAVYSTGKHGDYFFQFVDAVAKELQKTHPGKGLVTLAYMTHAKVPGFRLDPSVAVQFCFAANRSPFGENYRNELDLLKEWAWEGAGRPLYLWLYYTFPVESARNGKYHCFPGFFAHAIGEQFRLFRRYGIQGMFHCGYGQEVEAYVTFKLMDDPTRDVDALLDEYFSRLYGPAARPMKGLYLAIERTYCDPKLRPKRRLSGPELSWGYLGTEERMAECERLLQRAKDLARTEEEKRRIALFEHGVWSYMVAGRKQYVERKEAPVPSVSVPRVSPAGGDPARVSREQAAVLSGPWFDRGGATPTKRGLSGRVAHDGEYLYVELADACETAKLVASASVFPYDDWELFIGKQRDLPYRQYAIGPKGLVTALSHGEVNWRMNVPLDDHGIRVAADTSDAGRWVTRLALPLAKVVAGGAAAGDRLYLNVIRVSGPAISGEGRLGIDTWVSHCTVHEVDRLGELVLRE